MALSERRQAQIVEAARAVYVRTGFRHCSMDAIAAEARLAKRTLYLHFESKEAIFQALLDACERAIASRTQAVATSSAPLEERLADLLYAYFGTGLEWFGDDAHLHELHTLTTDDPGTYRTRNIEQELLGRVVALLLPSLPAAGKVTADELARVAVFAAVGAKRAERVDPAAYRRHVIEIARCLCAS